MAGLTPASATADLPAPLGMAGASRRPRQVLGRVVRSPAGLIGLILTAAVAALAVLADTIAPGDPFAIGGPYLGPPSRANVMGTDVFRRDVFSGIVHGARTSMIVVVWVVVISTVLGVLIGSLAGFRGGFIDDALMRFTEILQSVPRFLLAILVVGLYGRGIDKLIVLLGLTSWTLLARVVRAETLAMREEGFVEAARACGASGPRVLLRHIMPNMLPVVTVLVTLMASRIILIEASLSFLGLGDQNEMSWGMLINNARAFLDTAWWLSVFPGIAIALSVIGFNLLGDALNSALHPIGGTSPSRIRKRSEVAARNGA